MFSIFKSLFTKNVLFVRFGLTFPTQPFSTSKCVNCFLPSRKSYSILLQMKNTNMKPFYNSHGAEYARCLYSSYATYPYIHFIQYHHSIYSNKSLKLDDKIFYKRKQSSFFLQHSTLLTQNNSNKIFDKQTDVLSYGTFGEKLLNYLPKSFIPYASLMRIDKPTGTWLLLLPCWWGIALCTAPGTLPSLNTIALFGLGAFLMRSAGCIINDIWDRKFDVSVERTKSRPIASKQLSVFDAVVLLQGLLGCSLLVLLQFDINR